MSGNSQTANYGGRQPDNTQNIKQFITTDYGVASWVYKKLPNSTTQVITPSDQKKTVMIPKDLLVLGSINNPSDKNLKENIENIDSNDLIKVNPVSFQYKNDKNQKKHYGVIAQELETVYPELVSNDATGFKTVNYIEFIPLLISQMKCMQTQMRCMQEEIENLKNELDKKV
jgi:hypothetical protein